MTSTKKEASDDVGNIDVTISDVPWKTFEEKNKKYIAIGNEIFLILDEIDDSFLNKEKSYRQVDENFNNSKTYIETKKNSSAIIKTKKANEEFGVNAVSKKNTYAKHFDLTAITDISKQSIDDSIEESSSRQSSDLPAKDKILSAQCVLGSPKKSNGNTLFNSSLHNLQKNNSFQANCGILGVPFEENTVANNLSNDSTLIKKDSEIVIEEISTENNTDLYSIGSFANLDLSDQEKLVQKLIKKYKYTSKKDMKPLNHRNRANQACKTKNGLSTLLKLNENINTTIDNNIKSEENTSFKELKIMLKKMDFNVIIKNNKYVLETRIKDKKENQGKKVISQNKTELEVSSNKIPKSMKVVLPKIRSFSHLCTTMVENKVRTVNIPEKAYNCFNKDGHPTGNSDLKIICTSNSKRGNSCKVKKRKSYSQETDVKKCNKLAKIDSEIFKIQIPTNGKKSKTLIENSKKQLPLHIKHGKKVKNEKSTLFNAMPKDSQPLHLEAKNNLKKNEEKTMSIMSKTSFQKQVPLNNENSKQDTASETSIGHGLQKITPQMKYVKKVKESFAEALTKISEQELNTHLKNSKKPKGGTSKKLSSCSIKTVAANSEKQSEGNFSDIPREISEKQLPLHDENNKKSEENSINIQNNTQPEVIKKDNLSCAKKSKEIKDTLSGPTTDSLRKTPIKKNMKNISKHKRKDRLIVSTSLWGSPISGKRTKNNQSRSSHKRAYSHIHKHEGSSVTQGKESVNVKQKKAKERILAHKSPYKVGTIESFNSISMCKSIAECEGERRVHGKCLSSKLLVDTANHQVYLGSSKELGMIERVGATKAARAQTKEMEM